MSILLPYIILYKNYKKTLFLGIILAVITFLANIGLLTLSSWFLSVSAIDGITGIYNFNYILPAVCIRSTAIIRIVGRYFERLINHDVTFRILQYLRVSIFSKLLPLSPAKLIQFSQGDLLSRMIADIDALNHLYLRSLLPITVAFIVTAVVLLWLSTLNTIMAFYLGIIILIILFTLPSLFFYLGKSIGRNLVNARSEYCQQLTIWLRCQAELIAFGANQYYRLKMKSSELNWYRAQHRQSKLTSFSQALMMLISNLIILVVLWISTNNIRIYHQYNVLIATCTFCVLAMFEALTPITSAFQYLGQVIASSLRITQIIEQDPEIHFNGNYSIVPSQVSLYLDHVSFSYKGQLQNALNGIDLSVDVGTCVAILGHTGCGKTTLLQLITRAWDPQQGDIKINNIPLSKFNERTLRSTISVVPQYTYLFSSTLRDNLLLSSPESDDEKLCFVLEQVGLSKLLDCNGLDSWFGEGGRQLSIGELRRLAIARMLLHDAPLILLDEPTDGLDAVAEVQILNLLNKFIHNKTTLMVTHRLRELINFDNVIIMDDGKIIEQAKYSEFLAKNKFYRYFK